MSNRVRRRDTLPHKWEQQQLRAQQTRRYSRRVLLGLGAAVVAVVLVVIVVNVAGHSGKKKPTAQPSATPASCDWSVIPPAARGAELTDVGTPPATGMPRTGVAHMVITTSKGPIDIDLDLAKAPCSAASLSYLAGKKFFDNTACHRLTTGPLYALYCGDPSGTDEGGPAYRVLDENVPTGQRPAYPAGSVILINHGPNTNTSEFGLVFQDSDVTGPTFPVIGRITSGLPLVTEVGGAGAKDDAFESLGGSMLPGLGGGHPNTPVTVQTLTISAPSA